MNNKHYKKDMQSNCNKGFSLIELITFICIFAFTYAWSLFYFHGLGITIIELFISGPINKIGNFLRWTGSVYNYLLPFVFIVCSLIIGRIDAVLAKSHIENKNVVFQGIALVFKIIYKTIDFVSSTISVSSAIAVVGILAGKLKFLQLEEWLYFGSYINIALSVVLAIAFMIFKAKRKPAEKKPNTSKMFKDVTATQKTKFNFNEHNESSYNPKLTYDTSCFVLVGNNIKTKIDNLASYSHNGKKYVILAEDKFSIERFVLTNQNNFGDYVALIAKQQTFGAIISAIHSNDIDGYIKIEQNACNIVNIDTNPNKQNVVQEKTITPEPKFTIGNINGTFSFSAGANRVSKDTRPQPEKDFTKLCDRLIRFGYFNMHNVTELVTLAYMIQGLYDFTEKANYDETINDFVDTIDEFTKAKEILKEDCTKYAALLAQQFAAQAGLMSTKDDTITESVLEVIHSKYQKIIQTGELVAQGYVKTPSLSFAVFNDTTYAPDWFASASEKYFK